MTISEVTPPVSSVPSSIENEKVILIKPLSGWIPLDLRELWEHRELLFFFTWRDIKVRYKQTLLGASWAILQPVFSMIVFSVFFGQLAKMPSDGIPYPIFSYTGLLPWTFFAASLGNAANSLVRDANLLKKVYFPRLIIPISGVLGGLVDFMLAFLVLIGMMFYYDLSPSLSALLWFPVLLLLTMITSLGSGLWLAAMNVRYRDIRYVVPFLTQLWMYATPVVYPASLLDQPWRTIYAINPMVGVVEGFRWIMLGKGNAPGPMLAVSTLVTIIILIAGMFYFRRLERTFADVV
ncbi:MAG: ABC transporter permease [Chloroflexi bacterium]|nr:ABC transporter permease [Chloroflexota bacterium]